MPNSKIQKLREILLSYGKIAIALSGGSDSSVLLTLAAKTLGKYNCLALSVHTPYMRGSESAAAKGLCSNLGVKFEIENMQIPDEILSNPPDRCYICKSKIFSAIKRRANYLGYEILADGTNASDLSDYRPGMKALAELKIRSPFLESGIGKEDIFKIAKDLGVEVAPASACLMTRFAHGENITPQKLGAVDKAEEFVSSLGYPGCRVRMRGNYATLELQNLKAIDDFSNTDDFKKISAEIKRLGLGILSSQVREYSRGSMNIETQ